MSWRPSCSRGGTWNGRRLRGDLACPCLLQRGIAHRCGALVVIGAALHALAPDQGGLPPGAEEEGEGVSRGPGVGPKERGGGGGPSFCFTGGTDDHFPLVCAGAPMVGCAIDRA